MGHRKRTSLFRGGSLILGDKLYVADKPTLDAVNELVKKIDEVAVTDPAVAGSLANLLQTLSARLTSTRADNLDNLDATVSSRAPASTALSTSTWTSTRAGKLDKLDNLDTTVSSRAPASTALSTSTWTSTRAGRLDNLDAAISTRATSADSPNPTYYTNSRATKLDKLDTNIGSRIPGTTTHRDRIDTSISSRLASNDSRLNYLNASISSRATPADVAAYAGIDWSSKGFQTNTPTVSEHYSYYSTILNITGSGYVIGLFAPIQTRWALQIDGGSIYTMSAHYFYLFPLRFNSSLKITSDEEDCFAWVVLD